MFFRKLITNSELVMNETALGIDLAMNISSAMCLM